MHVIYSPFLRLRRRLVPTEVLFPRARLPCMASIRSAPLLIHPCLYPAAVVTTKDDVRMM